MPANMPAGMGQDGSTIALASHAADIPMTMLDRASPATK
jgi:hypothetical protein